MRCLTFPLKNVNKCIFIDKWPAWNKNGHELWLCIWRKGLTDCTDHTDFKRLTKLTWN